MANAINEVFYDGLEIEPTRIKLVAGPGDGPV